MKNAVIIVVIIVGGSALFLGATFLFLNVQGKLEDENLKALNQNPLLGAFVSEPPPKAETEDEAPEADPGSVETGSGDTAGDSDAVSGDGTAPVYFETPKGFSSKELMDVLDSARDAKTRSEKERLAVEVERSDLERLAEDLAERKAELERAMSEFAAAKTELDTAREAFRKEVITIEESEERMIRKLAEVYENMKEVESAAEHFNDMDLDQAVKILVRMDSAKAAKILPLIDAERVKILTEKISRFQERKKTEAGR